MAWSHEQLDEVFSNQCHLCDGLIKRNHYGHLTSAYGWEVDHDWPRALGGTDDAENLRPAHPACNRSKGALPSEEFREIIGAEASSAVPLLAIAAGTGVAAACLQPDPSRRIATGVTWGVGAALALLALDALL